MSLRSSGAESWSSTLRWVTVIEADPPSFTTNTTPDVRKKVSWALSSMSATSSKCYNIPCEKEVCLMYFNVLVYFKKTKKYLETIEHIKKYKAI